MITQLRLVDDGAMVITEVSCDGAAEAAPVEEVAHRSEVTIPLGGIYVRTVRRAGRPGAARTEIGDPGSAVLYRPGEPYRVSHPVPGHDRSLSISVRGGEVASRDAGPRVRRIPLDVTTGARRLVGELRRGRLDRLAAAERVAQLLAAVGRAPGGGRAGSSGRERRLANAVRLQVAGRLSEHLTLPQLGAQFGLSGWELARRFRRATGTSIHAYRIRLRVHEALERIDAGERDLTSLALDLGFTDHSHLTNVLRHQTGRPPSAFRHGRPDRRATQRTILQA